MILWTKSKAFLGLQTSKIIRKHVEYIGLLYGWQRARATHAVKMEPAILSARDCPRYPRAIFSQYPAILTEQAWPITHIYIYSEFRILTSKGRVSTKSFKGSLDVSLPTASQVYHLFCRVRWPAFSGFGLRPLSYLEHCIYCHFHYSSLPFWLFHWSCQKKWNVFKY